MFPPEITMLIRFVRPEKAIKCAMCGKMRKRLWTMLVSFRGQEMELHLMTPSNKFEALTPIFEDHPMAPIFIENEIANHALDSDRESTGGSA